LSIKLSLPPISSDFRRNGPAITPGWLDWRNRSSCWSNWQKLPIRELIETRTGRAIARGALYTALERLEAKGCLRSTMKQADAPRAGRARRYFALTPSGVAALRATHVALRRMSSGLEAILEH